MANDSTGTENGFSGRYRHDDRTRRDEFDRRLARYLEAHQELWDITALVEPLDLLGSEVGEAVVQLRRLPGGELSVTISFELPPTGHRKPDEPPGGTSASG